jgi:CRP/FNR family transcriptional regulator
LRDLIALVQEVSQRNVDRRLARFLAERGAAGPIAATHQEIASELGTAREVVSRLLKQFEAEGLVALERRQIVVSNLVALAKLHG